MSERLKIRLAPLAYEKRLTKRLLTRIDLVVIHCTELPDLAMARRYGERICHDTSQTGNAGHYYIDRNGDIDQYIAIDRVAHHVSNHNERSVGIELVNVGRYPHWYRLDHQQMSDPYPADQIASLIALLTQLKAQLSRLKYITGHENLDTRLVPSTDDPNRLVSRKCDPGPLFPWPQVLMVSGLKRYAQTPLSDASERR